ncbi:MAG: hypothetical protein HYY06_04615 [Deltaproteobacteria bacterium]|nr:hypothetical protein [Deltaproteobacteria bacterium]
MRWCVAFALVVSSSSTALGQPAEPAAPSAPPAGPAGEPEEESSNLDDFSHRYQVNLRATFGKGYRVAFAYGDHEVCGDDDETPCYSGSPAFTDLDLGFGVTEGLELSVSIRLGLEDEAKMGTVKPAFPLTLGLGVRSYPDPLSRVKLFIAARLLWDLTKTGAGEEQDFAVRAEPGLQVEIVRYVALYAQFGVTIGFLRWLRFEADAGGGVQFRVP